MTDESPTTDVWLDRSRRGDPTALAELFNHYRSRLKQMVQFRMDQHLAARIDASDVLQEVYLDVAGQIENYLQEPKVCFYVWLRGLTWERLLKLQRRHGGAKCRAVGRERPLPVEASSLLAAKVVAAGSSPSSSLRRKELGQRLQDALAKLGADDREVILMRDFEDMSNGEVAEALGLSASAATMRYGRALVRLKKMLEADWPGGESKP
jgi:RNA polymerase sigma-70 factor (ECF subfamily)